MLTKKKKYTEALGYLFNHAHNCNNCDRVNIGCDDCENDNTMECDIAYVRLDNLIEEHFDNPPLKFEELKVGMWVWDNYYKLYCLIDRIYSFNKFSVHYHFNTMQEFEETRFYRKEVEE